MSCEDFHACTAATVGAVVCLSQWSDIPFEAFAANCSDFCPYYKLGGGGKNLHAAMVAAKTAREAQEVQ